MQGRTFSAAKLVFGLLGGLISGGFVCVLAIFTLFSTTGIELWAFPLTNALVLLVLGVLVGRYGRGRQPEYALGALIGLSLVFLLNAACGFLLLSD